MKDKEFFERALGLRKPWKVKEVRMDIEKQRVEIEIESEGGTVWGEGGQRLKVQGYEKRKWRHLDTMQFETVIIAEVPRVKYENGKTEVVNVPWAERYSRMTRVMEEFGISVIEATKNISEASKLLRMSWRQVEGIMKRAVKRGLERRKAGPIKYIGIDEKGIRRGHKYATIVNDLENNRVLEVMEGRDEKAAQQSLDCLNEEQKIKVEAVTMDMWPAYQKAVSQALPQACIVHDKFHITKYLNEAVDAVRKQEHRKLMEQGDERLKGSKYDWLRNYEDLRKVPNFQELYKQALKTSRAWKHKETFAGFWNYKSVVAAKNFFFEWKKAAMKSQLKPIKRVALMLSRHLTNILNYVTYPITNALSEGLNSTIQLLISSAKGLPSFESLRTRVLFFCGKLDMCPRYTW